MVEQEIELKIQISNAKSLVKKLIKIGSRLKSKRKQIDILYNSKYFDFEEFDQSLRFRIEKSGQGESTTLAFKGIPKQAKYGHKIRDEFETPVNPITTRKILTSIGFEEVAVIRKKRESYQLNKLEINIDELKFGTFVEFEGKPKDIEEIRGKLGFKNTRPLKEGYIFLQQKWEKNQK